MPLKTAGIIAEFNPFHEGHTACFWIRPERAALKLF